MKLPCLAWLELSVCQRSGQAIYQQRALFHPRGLAGHLYWHALLPLHAIVFGGMPATSPGEQSAPQRYPPAGQRPRQVSASFRAEGGGGSGG